MVTVTLPISKSIANRVLILQALRGEALMAVDATMPEDIRILREALVAIHSDNPPKKIDLGNCGTAMRFLTAYCAQLKDHTIILDGSERMRKRPIGQLVEALSMCGADIWYLGEQEYPPLRIHGQKLYFIKHMIDNSSYPINNPASSQYVSALKMIGLPVETNSTSPYIAMTEAIIASDTSKMTAKDIEVDWSSAAFWYEYVALHGGEIELIGLKKDSLQGDKCVAEIFENLGVMTEYTDRGIVIRKSGKKPKWVMVYNFRNCPDLYPAIAIACKQLGTKLFARGTEVLRIKESDRLQAVKEYKSYGDHRIAMALLSADFACDDIPCINKSYPTFYQQLCALRG